MSYICKKPAVYQPVFRFFPGAYTPGAAGLFPLRISLFIFNGKRFPKRRPAGSRYVRLYPSFRIPNSNRSSPLTSLGLLTTTTFITATFSPAAHRFCRTSRMPPDMPNIRAPPDWLELRPGQCRQENIPIRISAIASSVTKTCGGQKQ